MSPTYTSGQGEDYERGYAAGKTDAEREAVDRALWDAYGRGRADEAEDNREKEFKAIGDVIAKAAGLFFHRPVKWPLFSRRAGRRGGRR